MMRPVKLFLEMIKFEHTLFALPLAYMGWLFAHTYGDGSIVVKGSYAKIDPSLIFGWVAFAWITVGMVCARTLGMTWNRIVDRSLDALNPRTCTWPLVTGAISRRAAIIVCIGGLTGVVLAAWQLNPLCVALSPIAVMLILGYPFTKRFTWLSHLWLGAILACAPMAGWIGVTGQFAIPPVWLSLFVLVWVAGFDIVYALLDVEFDQTHHLHSIPVRFGIPIALRTSFGCHLLACVALIGFGLSQQVGLWYWIGIVAIAMLLFYEHVIVRPDDPRRIFTAFFPLNGMVSLGLLLISLVEILGARLP